MHWMPPDDWRSGARAYALYNTVPIFRRFDSKDIEEKEQMFKSRDLDHGPTDWPYAGRMHDFANLTGFEWATARVLYEEYWTKHCGRECEETKRYSYLGWQRGFPMQKWQDNMGDESSNTQK